jgi:hypothetical protein
VKITTFQLSDEMLVERGIYNCPIPVGGEILGITSIDDHGNVLPAMVIKFDENAEWETIRVMTPYDGAELGEASDFDYRGSTTVTIDEKSGRMHLFVMPQVRRLPSYLPSSPEAQVAGAMASGIAESFRRWEKIASETAEQAPSGIELKNGQPIMRIAGR